MPRNLAASLKAKLASDSQIMVELVVFHFSPVLRLAGSNFDLTFQGNVYNSDQNLIRTGDVNESSDLRVGTTQITLGGADQAYLGLFLNENYINIRVEYWKAFPDPDYTIPDDDAILVFDGNMSGVSFDERNEESFVVVECASHWANFEMIAGRRSNDASQKAVFPNDRGAEFASQSVKDIKWGAP